MIELIEILYVFVRYDIVLEVPREGGRRSVRGWHHFNTIYLL